MDKTEDGWMPKESETKFDRLMKIKDRYNDVGISNQILRLCFYVYSYSLKFEMNSCLDSMIIEFGNPQQFKNIFHNLSNEENYYIGKSYMNYYDKLQSNIEEDQKLLQEYSADWNQREDIKNEIMENVKYQSFKKYVNSLMENYKTIDYFIDTYEDELEYLKSKKDLKLQLRIIRKIENLNISNTVLLRKTKKYDDYTNYYIKYLEYKEKNNLIDKLNDTECLNFASEKVNKNDINNALDKFLSMEILSDLDNSLKQTISMNLIPVTRFFKLEKPIDSSKNWSKIYKDKKSSLTLGVLINNISEKEKRIDSNRLTILFTKKPLTEAAI